jgi:hypothetical protein
MREPLLREALAKKEKTEDRPDQEIERVASQVAF